MHTLKREEETIKKIVPKPDSCIQNNLIGDILIHYKNNLNNIET
jgi:hypothetical protein